MAGSSTKVVVVAFVMNLGIALAKFLGFFFTHSSSMLAEAIHSLADTSNQIFLYLGLRRSQKLADNLHQFGYGKEQYVWSFMVAILIFALGSVFALYEGIHKLIEPKEIENVEWNLGILGVAIILEGYSSLVATKEIKREMGPQSFLNYVRKSKNQVLVTVLFEDYAALLGLIIAFGGNILFLATGNPLVDPAATILIGVLLAVIAGFLYKSAISLLVGESASEEDQQVIKEIFQAHPSVIELKELLTMHLSADQILLNAHVKFKNGITLEEVEDIIDDIEDQIVDKVPKIFKIFIETHQQDKVYQVGDPVMRASRNVKKENPAKDPTEGKTDE